MRVFLRVVYVVFGLALASGAIVRVIDKHGIWAFSRFHGNQKQLWARLQIESHVAYITHMCGFGISGGFSDIGVLATSDALDLNLEHFQGARMPHQEVDAPVIY